MLPPRHVALAALIVAAGTPAFAQTSTEPAVTITGYGQGRESTTYRQSIGTVWYVNRHRLKLSALHRETFNALGVRAARARATYAQMHVAF